MMGTKVYRYRFAGLSPLTFPDLTGYGYGELHVGDVVEVPVEIAHADLVAIDEKGRKGARGATRRSPGSGRRTPRPKAAASDTPKEAPIPAASPIDQPGTSGEEG